MKILKINKIDYSGEVYNLRIKSEDGLNHNYFANGICVSNCHTSRGNSVRDILLQSVNAEYKLGLSGTIKIEEKYSDFFRIQEFLGPLSMTLSASHLIENKYSPDVYIKMVYLDYPRDEPFVKNYLALREDGKGGKQMYDTEKAFIVSYEPRIDFISAFVKKLEGNTLILYINVKDGYGQRICDRIKEWREHVYYIDGGVDGEDRDSYQRIMESSNQMTVIELADRTIKVNQFQKVNLENGSVKLAKDLTIDDDISNEWISSQKCEYK